MKPKLPPNNTEDSTEIFDQEVIAPPAKRGAWKFFPH
jgi:hypothetical protein